MGILHDDEEDLRAELAAVTAERDAAIANCTAALLAKGPAMTAAAQLREDLERVRSERDTATRRAEVAEAALARVKQRAISEQGPFLDRSEPPENENYNCGKWDTARAILAAIGGDHV